MGDNADHEGQEWLSVFGVLGRLVNVSDDSVSVLASGAMKFFGEGQKVFCMRAIAVIEQGVVKDRPQSHAKRVGG